MGNMLCRQNALFEEWKKDIPGMITDGIVDEQQYESAPIKLCFLLKEVNGGENWDLCDFISSGGRPQTWDNISRWVYGFCNSARDIHWSEIENLDVDFRKKYLRLICAVNVKKSSGKAVADEKRIYDAARIDGNRLQRQIDIYHPQVLICCGTADSYFDLITRYKNPRWQMTSRGIWYVKEPDGRTVISYSHPEARVKDCLLYYGLIDAYKEIYKIV